MAQSKLPFPDFQIKPSDALTEPDIWIRRVVFVEAPQLPLRIIRRIVFRRGLMVNHDAWTAGPDEWTPVLPSPQLPERVTRRVDLRGHSVLVYREAGRVYAMEDACAHAGGPLSEGVVEDGVVTCPWHGSRFRLKDGAVMRGPATFPQLRLQARERQGQIEVRGRKG